MRFLIDCDGVMAQWTKMFIRVCQDQFGIEMPPHNGEVWDIFKYPGIVEKRDEIWSYILGTSGLIYGLEKYDYTDELLSKLRERGEVICVTSIVTNTVGFGTPEERAIPGFYADERIMWLINKAGFSREDVILAYKKHTIDGNTLIDDKPDNVIKWANQWYEKGYRQPVLWQPPEKSMRVNDDRLFHCGNVDELMKFIDSMRGHRG